MMSWRAPFARDSILWAVVFYVGMALNVGVAFIEDPSEYGISHVAWHWLTLINAVVTAIAGKMGMSYAELARNQNAPDA